jgi:hypothetical protein
LGLFAAAGISNVTNKLFGKPPVYQNVSVNNNGGSTAINMPGYALNNNPRTAAAFSIGFYAGKNINSRWKLITGLNYAYQSNTIKTGNRIDTTLLMSFGNTRVVADSYFQNGNSNKYKNTFHFLELPLLLQYGFGKSRSFYAESGATFNYLLGSNALLYSNTYAAYVNDAAAFNKLNVLINAGAGVNLLLRSKFSFSAGYQFRYGIGAITKTAFGDQHSINHLLYLRIPFKK